MRTRELERSELARLRLSPSWDPEQEVLEEEEEGVSAEPDGEPVEGGAEEEWGVAAEGALGLSCAKRGADDEEEGDVEDDVDFDDFDDDEEVGEDDDLDDDDFEDDDDDDDDDDLDEDDD